MEKRGETALLPSIIRLSMQFAEDRGPAEFIIRSCDACGVLVNNEQWTESFLLLPSQPIHAWGGVADPLSVHHFRTIIARQPELVLLGTGQTFKRPSPEIYGALLSRGIGLEAMTTAAACRTYNLLAQDGRQVAACMILPV